MKNNILKVINEAQDRQKAELNARLLAALQQPSKQAIINAPILARLGIKATTYTEDDDLYGAIDLVGQNGLYAAYYPSMKRFMLPEGRQATLNSSLDLVDMFTNMNHAARRASKVNRTWAHPVEGLDDNDLLAVQAKERVNYWWKYGQDTTGAKYILHQAEQRTGLSRNPDGKPRIIKRVPNEK